MKDNFNSNLRERKKMLTIIALLPLLLSLYTCAERFTYQSQFDQDDLIPIFNPPGGTYHNEQYVTITTKVEGATIRYTIDGTEPSDSSPVYSDSIYISMPAAATIIKAKASKAGWDTKSSFAEYILRTATPTFNPPAGDYESPQFVEMICETAQAVIRYTTDGSEPDTTSTQYIEPILVNRNTTLKAIASKESWASSELSIAEYNLIVAVPTFNPPGGAYSVHQRVSINCNTEGAEIRYTTDGNDPTSSSVVYSVPIDVHLGTTLKAKGFKEGWTASQTVSAQYFLEGMVFVHGGTFNPTDNYTVTLSSFFMGKYEVTQFQYQSVMGTNPSSFSGNHNRPVETVSWFDAIEYCNLLSIREGLTPAYSYGDSGTNPAYWPTGWNTNYNNHTNVSCDLNANGYRLPTEMEWEFAARGGVPAQNAGTFNTTYSGSNNIDDVAWYSDNSDSRTHDVGTKAPNELGLYDMSGNVWNWVWDIRGDYPNGSYNDPKGASRGVYRVPRGGSWRSIAPVCSVSNRGHKTAEWSNYSYGFRVSRVIR